MFYPSSENKGADQLRGYREADLRLCFAYAKSRFSHNEAHYENLSPCVNKKWSVLLKRLAGPESVNSTRIDVLYSSEHQTADPRLVFRIFIQIPQRGMSV